MSPAARSIGVETQQSKDAVMAFVRLAFEGEKQPREAAERYMAEDYIEHNPHFEDGREAFVTAIEGWLATLPEATFEFKRVIAEGEMVAVHTHLTMRPGEGGHAVVDIFRVENGRLAEHWDVLQAVPAEAANSNTMF